jgi:hypothetical protein
VRSLPDRVTAASFLQPRLQSVRQVSFLQVALQPSLLCVLPSSHFSLASSLPLPQVGLAARQSLEQLMLVSVGAHGEKASEQSLQKPSPQTAFWHCPFLQVKPSEPPHSPTLVQAAAWAVDKKMLPVPLNSALKSCVQTVVHPEQPSPLLVLPSSHSSPLSLLLLPQTLAAGGGVAGVVESFGLIWFVTEPSFDFEDTLTPPLPPPLRILRILDPEVLVTTTYATGRMMARATSATATAVLVLVFCIVLDIKFIFVLFLKAYFFFKITSLNNLSRAWIGSQSQRVLLTHLSPKSWIFAPEINTKSKTNQPKKIPNAISNNPKNIFLT